MFDFIIPYFERNYIGVAQYLRHHDSRRDAFTSACWNILGDRHLSDFVYSPLEQRARAETVPPIPRTHDLSDRGSVAANWELNDRLTIEYPQPGHVYEGRLEFAAEINPGPYIAQTESESRLSTKKGEATPSQDRYRC